MLRVVLVAVWVGAVVCAGVGVSLVRSVPGIRKAEAHTKWEIEGKNRSAEALHNAASDIARFQGHPVPPTPAMIPMPEPQQVNPDHWFIAAAILGAIALISELQVIIWERSG